ncbi:retrotransposon hot spot (RHS) protein [Trypanosoma cruzi]|nr:retrotransposon hot spot (RHS) protein [Trypanosoma cruzi]
MLHRTGVVMASCRDSGDDADAAARHVAGSKERPQWTMSSSVKEILLERTAGAANMKLNDFLPVELGEEWVANKNGDDSMEMFFFETQDVYPGRSIIGHYNGIAVLRSAG